jgi:hypothetical protein
MCCSIYSYLPVIINSFVLLRMTITQSFSKLSAVAAGLAVAFALIAGVFATATPARAAALTSAQVSSIISLLQSFGADAQTIANVQASLTGGTPTGGSTGGTTTGGACPALSRSLQVGSTGADVMALQKFLNGSATTQVAATGAGSPGLESSYFGPATKAAVIKFQTLNSVSAIGIVGPATRAAIAAVCGHGTTGGTTPTGPGITVSAGAQPANALAVESASRVPFTTFTVTNNSGVVQTINGVTVTRTGFANDSVFSGIVLLNSDGTQIGNSSTLNSNHQATIGGNFTINPGQTMTLTVAGNMAANLDNYSGQIASLQVAAVNSTAAISGVLPINGASHTINSSLTIGTAQVDFSGFDPRSSRSQSIGTTGLTFAGVRITANTEDEKLFSIRWNQTGSAGATDLSNLVTVVNGTSYPVTVDASGKYFTANIPGGLMISKGNSADVYLKGDITGSSASGRTVEFDIYRASDIYLVGQTYGYGITPTASNQGSFTAGGNNSASGFQAAANPFYFGAGTTVTGGTLSTVSTASNVPPANIAVNVPNQTLGGFTTNFTGEAVTVQGLTLSVATSSGASQLQNVTLVDSNGVTVAGPVDATYVSSGVGSVVFNTSITFPVGVMTYTIKGKVSTGATTGSTYTLSTNTNTWTSAVGQTSGSYISIPATTLTMSTMTVQSGQLTISASANPAATTLMGNQNNVTLANIVLNASQSGEDVRVSSLPIVVNATSSFAAGLLASNLTNCQLFNNGVAVNTSAIGASQWVTKTDLAGGSGNGIEANFVFNNQLVVTKGSSVTLALQCNVGGSLYNGLTFSAGVHPTYGPSGVTGAQSGNSISATLPSGGSASGTMTLGTATLMATVPTPTSYSQVAGGSTNVTIGTFTLQPTSGQVSLQNIALSLNSNFASTSDLMNGVATIYQGSTPVGSVSFNGLTPTGGYYIATSSLSNVNLAQNAQTTFTIKADIAPIGLGNSGMSGREIRIGLNNANGSAGSSAINTGPVSQPSTGVAIFKSFPTVAVSSLPTSGVADGRLVAFAVTANSANPVGIAKLNFTISTTSATVSSPSLYVYTDAGLSNPAGGTTNGIGGSTSLTANAAATTFSTPFEIPAGSTYYFVLKGTVSPSGSTYNVNTTLVGDGSDLAPAMYTVSALSSSNFVWSPNSTTTSATTNVDWTNGFGVSGLPSFGISQNRTQ